MRPATGYVREQGLVAARNFSLAAERTMMVSLACPAGRLRLAAANAGQLPRRYLEGLQFRLSADSTTNGHHGGGPVPDSDDIGPVTGTCVPHLMPRSPLAATRQPGLCFGPRGAVRHAYAVSAWPSRRRCWVRDPSRMRKWVTSPPVSPAIRCCIETSYS